MASPSIDSPSNESKSIQWHTRYDVEHPPPKPAAHFVRFVVISDTHSTQPSVPDGDVLLHSGDLTDLGATEALEKQLDWLATLPHKQKFIIGGNHDYGLCNDDGWYEKRGKVLHNRHGFAATNPARAQELVQQWQAGAPQGSVRKYVKDERITFDAGGKTWSLYGSPWSPEFGRWAWNYKRGQEAKELYRNLPSTDILLTHTPPHKIGRLDVITDGKTSVGCEELTEQLQTGQIRPLLHCFGHIHEAQGVHLETWNNTSSPKANDESSAAQHEETLFVNSAIVEMDMRSLVVQTVAKTPLIYATRLSGVKQPDWLQIHQPYEIKYLPVIVDIDPKLVGQSEEQQAKNKL